MHKEQLDSLKAWFTPFAASYYRDGDVFVNENIRLKECHTHRVCKEMRDLAAALGKANGDAVLAETIALLHDVGRFPQFLKYRTYKDTISENHCLMALNVIEEHRLADGLAADERSIVRQAVEFHGVKEIPPMDERAAHFTRMIRDADKLDIFYLLSENYKILANQPDKFKWELEFPNTAECNSKILEAIMAGHTVDYRDLRTVTDAKLLQIGWVFDINFDHTLRRICDCRYLQTIIDLLPKTEPINRAANRVMQYVQQRIVI
ncbi:MAG: HD domain-containing protein [Planctomycetaceae bacterium]|nr:HD domain-containing protein [Planctomycetaceae bacterium]